LIKGRNRGSKRRNRSGVYSCFGKKRWGRNGRG